MDTDSVINKSVSPYSTPFLAKSTYPVAHSRANRTPISGPIGPSRRLKDDEIIWKTIGPVNSFGSLISAPYPDGRRVIWVGGYDRITKLDADTLDVLTTYAIGDNTFFGDEEIRRHIDIMDKLDDQKLIDYAHKLWRIPFRSVVAFYRFLSSDNELYIPHRQTDGSISLRVYGEVDASDPSSRITLRREWKIPPEISDAVGIMGVNLTQDGMIIMATMDGVVIALSRDFTETHMLKLPRKDDESAGLSKNKDVWSSFLRNGLTVDDQGGIYIVTRDNMHRIQWTGKKLSLDEADGAWTAPYSNEKGIGSGTTPALMGWGSDEDHLLVIADAMQGNNLLVFWRDDIPDDWVGLPGYDRRVAGVTPIQFGVADDEDVQVENTPIIMGYGVFLNNTYPVEHLPDQGSPTKQWMAESYLMNKLGHEAKGGAMIRWDPKLRELKPVWQTQTNFVSTVCTVSDVTEVIYCWGARDGEWTMEGTDWHTGESSFHYVLGKSQRYNPLGGLIVVAPNGAIDCACTGGLGLVRVKPKAQ